MKARFLKNRRLFPALILVIFISLIIFREDLQNNSISKDAGLKERVHFSYFLDQKSYQPFYENIGESSIIKENVYGGILPHHLIAKREFGRFFTALEKQKPKVVVVIGPNHMNVGKSGILSTSLSYYTPYGILKTDSNLIERLTESELVKKNDLPFDEEHSISAETAFIKKTFPEAKFIPIILKSNTTEEDADRLGVLLNKILPENSLVLASVDFSHYQPDIVAGFHDKTSLSAIKNFDFEHIYNLEIDSPASLVALLSYLKIRGAQKMVY